jgi:hypothetical protein
MPVAIMAGKGDKVVFARQAKRLQARIAGLMAPLIWSGERMRKAHPFGSIGFRKRIVPAALAQEH